MRLLDDLTNVYIVVHAQQLDDLLHTEYCEIMENQSTDIDISDLEYRTNKIKCIENLRDSIDKYLELVQCDPNFDKEWNNE